MRDEVVNKDMRRSYLDLHIIALIGASKPRYARPPYRGIESVM
jgi:hypothetical protein